MEYGININGFWIPPSERGWDITLRIAKKLGRIVGSPVKVYAFQKHEKYGYRCLTVTKELCMYENRDSSLYHTVEPNN